MPGRRYTEEEKREKLKIICRVYESGGSVQKAGKAAGVSRQTARNWMREDGMKLRQTGSGKEIEYDQEDLKELADKGLTRKEIAKKMYVSATTVGVWLRENGIEINKEAGKAREQEKKDPSNRKKPVKKCRTCIYRSSNSNYGCNYIGVTGHCRILICTVAGCTVYQKGKRLRNRKEELADA